MTKEELEKLVIEQSKQIQELINLLNQKNHREMPHTAPQQWPCWDIPETGNTGTSNGSSEYVLPHVFMC